MKYLSLLLISSASAEFGMWEKDAFCLTDQPVLAEQYGEMLNEYDEGLCQQFCNDAMAAGVRTMTFDGRDAFCCSFLIPEDGIQKKCSLYLGYDIEYLPEGVVDS